MTESVHHTLRRRLREAIERDDRTLTDIAKAAGYTPGYLSSLAGGQVSRGRLNPTVGALWAIADTLGVDPLWLLGGGEEMPTSEARPVAKFQPLPEAIWAEVDTLRLIGHTWRDVARYLKTQHDLDIGEHNLRRRWTRRKNYPQGLAT